ncbi:MAG: ABC transporter substrate-binding protein [Armatimonadetes bacterium]|nr:ABC transporter substrate-binding protein [Armatimonadota bacterium]
MILRQIFTLATATFVFALFGGGCQNEAKPGTASSATPAGKKLKIGVSVPAADHGWTAGMVWWAEQAMKLYPDVEWTFASAENPENQVKDLETMMAAGVDAVVILATESAPITPTAEQMHERGILLVSVDRGFLKPVADVFIEGDNKSFGRKAAQYMVEKLGGQGKIVILEGIPSTVNTDRVESAMEVFGASPGIQVLDRQTGMWNKEKALNVMQTFLLKHKQIDAVWAADDDMALGVEQALKEAGRDRGVWILGGGGMKDIVKRVMDNDSMFPADITYPPSMIAVGIQKAVSILRDGRERVMQFTPKHMIIDVDLITPENAKGYYFPESVF